MTDQNKLKMQLRSTPVKRRIELESIIDKLSNRHLILINNHLKDMNVGAPHRITGLIYTYEEGLTITTESITNIKGI